MSLSLKPCRVQSYHNFPLYVVSMHSDIVSDTEVPLKSVFVFLCEIYEHLFWQHAWVWLLWLLSQVWISQHIWKPNVSRLMSTEVLFCMPMYDSLFVDQSLAFNRRNDKKTKLSTEVKKRSLLPMSSF